MPKPLKSKSKELVASLVSYFEKERDNGTPLLPLTAVREGNNIYYTVSCCDSFEYSKISQTVRNGQSLQSPKRRRNRPKMVANINTLVLSAICNTINEMYERMLQLKKKLLKSDQWLERYRLSNFPYILHYSLILTRSVLCK
ncbi:hypothetical protein ABEB36_004578 [Hypothenemus hampei]|uniref:Uncharacterized protein n=1 Tax=Hypothenemus hampei TaxID=57062 RepID=A0ABD1F445_HYPHA